VESCEIPFTLAASISNIELSSTVVSSERRSTSEKSAADAAVGAAYLLRRGRMKI